MNNLTDKILNLKKEKNAIILAHYYVKGDLQDIADFVGDSLALSQQAAKTNADIILFIGVHFMAETAKILSPTKKVLIPDINAGCSLADSCPEDDFSKFISLYPNRTVISYVNTTAKIKALSDIICTSSNAVQIVESLPKDKGIIFGPDKNLGDYINKLTGRNMILWDGACHVHHKFSLERILELKKLNPKAEIIAHPECQKPILLISDFIGSTSALLNYTGKSKSNTFIVATESGILHKMKSENPNKEFIPAPGDDPECACNDCEFMKLHNLEKVYNCLLNESPEIFIDNELSKSAFKSIKNMLDVSQKLGL